MADTVDGGPPTEAALRLVKASKRFGGVHALSDVSVSFAAGRITAVLGENGAGKSTLIRLCSGENDPDGGEIFLGRDAVRMRSPIEAAALGIAVVHQEPQLVASVTVAENIFLTRLGARGAFGRHSRRVVVGEARRLLDELGLANDVPAVDRLCQNLSAAERQMVEIARALAGRPRVLFLDEPNSSLTTRETDRLFDIVQQLRDRGVAVVLVSHRLSEVYRIAEHVIVLRDGQKVGEGAPGTLTAQRAIALMAGERLAGAVELAEDGRREAAPDASAVPVLSVRGAAGAAFVGVDLDFRAGEVVGMAGLVGAGRTEIARAVIGADPLLAGTIQLHGRRVTIRSPRQALRQGIAFISEERRTAVFFGHDVRFNLTCAVLDRFGRLGWFSRRRQTRFARDRAQAIGVKAAGVDAPIRSLSGGNQQKVLLARALAAKPALLILDEPTRGVDVRTKGEIYRLLRRLAHEEGLAVWFISSELDEVLQLADRIVVIREGRVADSMPRGPGAARVVAAALGETLADAVATAAVASQAAELKRHPEP